MPKPKNAEHPVLTMSTADARTNDAGKMNVTCDCGKTFLHDMQKHFVACPGCQHLQATISLFVRRD